MTDKYEEFKKWFDCKGYSIRKCEDKYYYNIYKVTKEFEEEQEEKQKEKEIKNIIKKVVETTKKHTVTGKIYFEDGIIEGIYIELKKEGYLK